MKKVISVILVLVLSFVLSGCIFEEASIFYSSGGESDGFSYGVNELANCCFVSKYTCDEYFENMEITIPDEYQGIPITQIGGYVGPGAPHPFFIDLLIAPDGSEFAFRYGSKPNTNEYNGEYLVFSLNIGKNIETIEYVMESNFCVSHNDDGDETQYIVVYNINCSSENKHFYSENGRLYNKKTDELITDFDYAADYIK